MRLSAVQAVLAGLVVGTGLGVCSVGCMTDAERRAVTVADCVAQMALGLPQRALPKNPADITEEDLLLAVQVVDGVRACRRAASAAPDGGT